MQRELAALQAGQQAILRELNVIETRLAGQQPTPGEIRISTEGSSSIGNKAARIAIVEFSDFQCPYCAGFFNHTYPVLYSDYVKSGRVVCYFHDFPLGSIHPEAAKAAEAAHCADEQGKFEEMHDRLFSHQQELGPRFLPGHAKALGLDQAQFGACLDGGKYAAQVTRNLEAGQRLGVKGTPSFFVGSYDPVTSTVSVSTQLNGAQPFSAFKTVLDGLLGPGR